jgi:glutamate-1-semialdehyde 2,1-aminomutase
MKIVATIQAKMSSSRLPKKVMANIYENLNTIEIIVTRVKKSKLMDDIIVVTTNYQSDDRLVNFLKKKYTILSPGGATIVEIRNAIKVLRLPKKNMHNALCAQLSH